MPIVLEFYIPSKDRKKALGKFSDHFDTKTSSKIEKGLYAFSEQYCKRNGNILTMGCAIYNDQLDNLIYNLDQNCSTIKKIKRQINKGEYNPYNLVYCRPEELDENKWAKIIMRKLTSEEKLKNLPTIEWKPCRDCKNKKFFFYQQQTRSADEPMTTFYICNNCKKTYRVNN